MIYVITIPQNLVTLIMIVLSSVFMFSLGGIVHGKAKKWSYSEFLKFRQQTTLKTYKVKTELNLKAHRLINNF